MKTYASALTRSCPSALAPEEIEAAVKKLADKEERIRNVIVYGLEVTAQEDIFTKIQTVLSDIDEKPILSYCRRVGFQKPGATRLVKFSVSSLGHAAQVIKITRKLCTKEGYWSVYIAPDRSVEERKVSRSLSKRSS